MRLVIGALVCGVIFGFVADTPDTEYRIVHDTKHMTITETETVEVVSQACLDAVDTAEQIRRISVRITENPNKRLDLMSDVRIDMINGDISTMNDNGTKVQKLREHYLQDVLDLQELHELLPEQVAACKDDSDD